MGRVINNRSLAAKELPKLTPPVLLCVSRPDYDNTIKDCGYETIRLNLLLARSLVGLDLREIRSVLTNKVREIIPANIPVYLMDYEMLFDPRYEIDVIRLFIEISIRNKLIVKWCGTATEDMLIYAEQGYADYKQYRVRDYDVAIVK